MDRRRFDHLYEELSVALGRLAPRYALWITLGELGLHPEALTRTDTTRFCDRHLSGFLREQGLWLPPRQRRRLERAVARFDPELTTPYEHMARMGGKAGRPS